MLQDALVLCPLTLRKDLFACTAAEYRGFVAAGAAAGYSGVSLSAIDARLAAGDGMPEGDLLGLLRAHGLDAPMVEAATAWATGQVPSAIEEHVQPMLDLAVEAGATTLTAVSLEPKLPSVDDAARGLARVCALAAERGLRVALEFLPWSPIRDIATGWDLIQRSGAANGGLLIDTWHWQRSGSHTAALDSIPPERIYVVQLCDAAAEPSSNLGREALSGRLLPGEGVADLVGLLRRLDRMGADPIIAPEVFSHALVDRGPKEMTQRVADASRAVLAEVRA